MNDGLRSNLTPRSGKFFAPDAPVNTRCSIATDVSGTTALMVSLRGTVAPARLVLGPVVWHVVSDTVPHYIEEHEDRDGIPGRSVRFRLPDMHMTRHQGWTVVVDHLDRTVLSARDWTAIAAGSWRVSDLEVVSLDRKGWGSHALGLILEREITTKIEHAIAVHAPVSLYGRRLRLRSLRVRPSAVEELLVAPLVAYGAIVTGVDDRRLSFIVERSSARALADDVGPIYRQIGIGHDTWPLTFTADEFEVVALREPSEDS